jgi:glycosyltransferase involved in cell wall biosynthesis
MGTESLRPPLTGIGNYTFNLLREFQKLTEIETIDCVDAGSYSSAANALTMLERSLGISNSWNSKLRSSLRAIPFSYCIRYKLLAHQSKRGGKIRKDYVYHEPNFVLRPHEGACVVTVHDLSFIHHPEFHPSERVSWLMRQLPNTLDRANFVITDSESVRTELIEQFSVRPDKVKAIYLGVDNQFKPRPEEITNPVLARYGLFHGRYIAFIGTIEPRKGIARLLDAWQDLPSTVRRSWPLVIAGAPGWRNTGLMERVQYHQLKGEVKFLQYVSPSDLPFIYAGAKIFVYPSVYEGFGLPVLEAMASGVPVICGINTSMAEFSKGACKFFDVYDTKALTLTMLELLDDTEQLNQLIKVGKVRSEDFSWALCAKQTFEVYKSL